jgi:hypothetical protein
LQVLGSDEAHRENREATVAKSLFKEKAFWFVILLSVVLFSEPLFSGKTFYVRDTTLQVLPQHQVLFGRLAEQGLPLWNDASHGGQPALANLTFAPLYPLHVLYLFLPFLYTFNLLTVLHLIACPIAAYICARSLRYAPSSSCVVALIFGLGGYTLSLANLLTMLRGTPYIPLMVALWHLRLDTGKTRWFLLSMVAGTMQVFAGAPGACGITMLLLLLWSLAYPYAQSRWYTRMRLWVFLALCVYGLAAVQLVPTAEMASWSARSPGVDFDSFTKWSLYWSRLPELIVPAFWMNYSDGSAQSLWGWKFTEELFPFVLSIYIGAVSLFLALLGGLQRANSGCLARRLRVALLAMFMGCLFLSLGRFAPFSFFKFLYHYVPLITIFRFPVKFLLGGLLPLALLAGYACERYFGTRSRAAPSRYLCLTVWGIGVISGILAGAFALSDTFAIGLQSLVFQQAGEHIRASLQKSFIHLAAIWFLFACLCQYRAWQWRFWQPYLLVLLLAIDLFAAGKHVNKYAPPALYDRPPAVRMVSEVVNNGRLYKARYRNEKIMLAAPPAYDDYLWSMRWKIEILEPYAPLLYNIPFIFYSDVERLSQKYVYALTKIISTVPWQQRLPFLSAAAVTAIITQEELALAGVHFIAEIPNKSHLKYYLYRNDRAVNRIAFVSDWKVVASDGAALYTMARGSFRPESQVILQRPEKTFLMRPVTQSFIQELAQQTPQPCAAAEISQRWSGSSSAGYVVTNACDGFLVFAEPYYPGWQIRVDQQPAPILRANYAFSAVYLKAGKHIVQRQYRPASLMLGAAISLVFCCVIGIGVPMRAWLRRPRRT